MLRKAYGAMTREVVAHGRPYAGVMVLVVMVVSAVALLVIATSTRNTAEVCTILWPPCSPRSFLAVLESCSRCAYCWQAYA